MKILLFLCILNLLFCLYALYRVYKTNYFLNQWLKCNTDEDFERLNKEMDKFIKRGF